MERLLLPGDAIVWKILRLKHLNARDCAMLQIVAVCYCF